MPNRRPERRRHLALMLALLTACGGSPGSVASNPAPAPARVTRDSTSAALVPANLGSLHQDDISIVLQPVGVRATALPLEESIIRTLAPDSYRSLRGILEAKRALIAQRAQMRGTRDPRVWYLKFYGLAPNARFMPTDLTITSGGRDYRPFDVVPITTEFGSQRLQPRDTQAGLLLFDEGVDVNQNLVVSMGAERNTQWSNENDGILSRIEAERIRIRALAGRTNP